nr:DUF3772 domain-containing protein [Actibacterium sp. 188UL27-1]
METQLADLRAPVIRAEEAFSRAGGLIREIDGIIRARQAEDLFNLGPSPLNPVHWEPALLALQTTFRDLGQEWTRFFSSPANRAVGLSRLPVIIGLTALGILFLLRARRWSFRAQRKARELTADTWHWLAETLASSLGLFLPMIGGGMLIAAVTATGAIAPVTDRLLEALFDALVSMVVASWLANTLFPRTPLDRPFLPIAEDRRPAARRAFYGLGIAAMAVSLAVFLVPPVGADEDIEVILFFPALFLAGWFSFRLGRLLSEPVSREEPAEHQEGPAELGYRDRVIGVFGKIMMVLSVLGVVAAAIGYSVAANALLPPLVETIGAFSIVLVANRVLTELYAALTGNRERLSESLFPVLTGMLLVLIALPFLALSWGARVADLTELWATFLEGFSFGETRISPANFLTFVAVFAVGFLLTRIIQGTLRNTILPKTRIDPGGQTAAISGVGYVGIFLAALLAITTAGIDLSGLAIVAGALSVGIGFGLQTIVSNFVSGIILLIERPVSEGDWIEVGGVMGTVRSISVRSTRIETFDRTDVIVPNADLIASHVTNWTKTNLTGRLIIPVGVAYGTDTRKVQAILQEIAEDHPMVIIKPPPLIVFAGFGADSLDFEMRVILRNVNFKLGTQTDLNHAIVERFTAEGIEIPFAQRDVWLRNPETLRGQPEAGPIGPPLPPMTEGSS